MIDFWTLKQVLSDHGLVTIAPSSSAGPVAAEAELFHAAFFGTAVLEPDLKIKWAWRWGYGRINRVLTGAGEVRSQ